MRILFFCSPQGNQRALAHKLAAHVHLECIVNVAPRRDWTRRKEGPLRQVLRLCWRAVGAVAGLPLRKAWTGMLSQYDARFPAFPDAPTVHVADINDPAVMETVARVKPDLVVVSGTNLLKQPLIGKIMETGRIVNLHTGISPYIKGGPNCTNWCLALRRFDLIGNTVMWLDAGIDSGNLIATERTPLTGEETLTGLHIAVMEHAHDLYLRCIRLLAQGHELPNVHQAELGSGRLFLTRHWTAGPIARAVANFTLYYRRGAGGLPLEALRLVSPTQGVVPMHGQARP